MTRDLSEVTFPLSAQNVAEVVAERDAEIERLQNTLKLHAGDCQSLNGEVTMFKERAEEAEAEIERLQALLEAKTTPGYELLATTIEKQDAEIERLRWSRKLDYVLRLEAGIVRGLRAGRESLKAGLDTRLNNALVEMKPGYDDSITGFNEAWDIMRKYLAGKP